jgi:hypothetical protein
MKPFSQVIYLLILVLLSPAANAEALDRDAVLEKLIQSYGGEENLRKLDSMVQEWDFVALRGNRHGKDIRSIRLPGQLRVELTYPDRKETRILNKTASHVIFRDAPAEAVGGPQRDAMRLQLMRLYSPLNLRERRDDVSLMLDGEYCALSLHEGGLRSDYLVDVKNWRIEKVVGTLSVNGAEMRFLTEYSDFALVDSVLVHQKENKFVGNVNTAILQLRQIELQAGLSDDTFLP